MKYYYLRMRVIPQIRCLIILIFINLLFKLTRIRRHRRGRSRSLACEEISNVFYFWLTLFYLFPKLLLQGSPCFSQMSGEFVAQLLGNFHLNFATQLFLTSFFGGLSDALIQPLSHFACVVVVDWWRPRRCCPAGLLSHNKAFRPKPIHTTFVVEILHNPKIVLQ